MVNSSKKTIMLLTTIKLLLFFRLKSLKEISIRLSSTKVITFSSNLLGTSLTLDFLKSMHTMSRHDKNEALTNLFNSITSLALWKNRPIRVGNSKKKVKKLNKRKRFRKRFSIKLKYNVRRLMFRFKRSYLWRKVKRSKKGRLSSLMPVLPLHFNKQKVLSRKAKKRRRNKKVIRATFKNWKSKKRFKKAKRSYKSFSRQRLYMTKSTLNLHYPRFFVKKTITRKSSYLNLQKNRQFRKNLFKGVINNLQYIRKDSSVKMQSKRKASLFIKGKELFNRNSIKIGPVERRLLVNDLNYLDLKGFFTKVNLLPVSSLTKHPFLSKKKNFKRSVFMLRFFKGVDYSIIRSNLEISKFLNSSNSKKLWRKADPALVLKRVIIRQLRGRFRRMVSRAANSCQLMKPLSFEKELTKFKSYTMGFFKDKTFKKAVKVRRALFISKFSNDYNYLLDKSPVALSTSLSFLSGAMAVRGLSKLSTFNPLTHEVNLPNHLDASVKVVESVEDPKHLSDLNSNKINLVDKEPVVINHKKVKFVLKNFFNRSLFDKAVKLLEDSVKQKKITYNAIALNKSYEYADVSKIDTNRGALTGVSNEVAKYSDLLSKADNNSILKINRNPLLENDQDILEPHYCDLDLSLKDILSCLDNASLKRSSGLALNYLHYLSAYNFGRSVINQGDALNLKNEDGNVNANLSLSRRSAIRYGTKPKYNNSLKIKLINASTAATKKSRYKLKSRSLSSKNKNLKSVFYKLKLSWRMPLRRNIKVRLSRKLDKKKLRSIVRTLSPINLRVLREKSLKLLENKECNKGSLFFANIYKEKKIFERGYSRIRLNKFKSMRFLRSSLKLLNINAYNLNWSDIVLRRPKININRGFNRKKKNIIKDANLLNYTVNLMKVRPFRYKTRYSYSNRDFLKKKKTRLGQTR